MKIKSLLLSIYDNKTKTWSDIITVPNKPTAIRVMDQLIKSGSSIQSKYPADFDLYNVANMLVDEEGDIYIEQLSPMDLICHGTDFVEDSNNGK